MNEVRLVGENVEQGVYPFDEALRMAEDMGLDLVEISASAVPPVCRIIEYKKFLYDLKKKQKEIKAKQATVEMKEIRFGPNTDEHDLNFKLKHARKFLRGRSQGEGLRVLPRTYASSSRSAARSCC